MKDIMKLYCIYRSRAHVCCFTYNNDYFAKIFASIAILKQLKSVESMVLVASPKVTNSDGAFPSRENSLIASTFSTINVFTNWLRSMVVHRSSSITSGAHIKYLCCVQKIYLMN